jgi:hypothetical protein
MKALLILPTLALFSLTGCVAAIPMAMQLMTSAGSSSQLCSMAKMSGQSMSFCEHDRDHERDHERALAMAEEDRRVHSSGQHVRPVHTEQTPDAVKSAQTADPAGTVNTAER